MLSAINSISSRPVRPVSRPVKFGNRDLVAQHYDGLADQFTRIYDEAKQNPVTEKTPQPDWITKLQAAARTPAWNKTIGDFVLEANAAKVKELSKQYEERTLLLEKQQQVMSSGSDYQQLNSSFADLEAKASGMNTDTRALFVGSGPQPNSVVTYANYAGHVTGIDIAPEAIEATRSIAEKSGGKIQFERADGQTYNYAPYSHIGIAVMVPEKRSILERIQKTASAGTTVIIRSVDGLKKAMYESVEPGDLPGFEKVATVHGTDHNITHAMILKTKPVFGVPKVVQSQEAIDAANGTNKRMKSQETAGAANGNANSAIQ